MAGLVAHDTIRDGRNAIYGPLPASNAGMSRDPTSTAPIRHRRLDTGVRVLLLALLLLAGASPGSRPLAARGDGTKPAEIGTLELVVVEARRNCPLCQLFRDVVAPVYLATPRAARAPLRYVDVAVTDPDSLRLTAPIEIIPTVVLMRDGAEVDRLVGYTGPEIFMSAVGHMLGEPPAGPGP